MCCVILQKALLQRTLVGGSFLQYRFRRLAGTPTRYVSLKGAVSLRLARPDATPSVSARGAALRVTLDQCNGPDFLGLPVN